MFTPIIPLLSKILKAINWYDNFLSGPKKKLEDYLFLCYFVRNDNKFTSIENLIATELAFLICYVKSSILYSCN